MFPFNLLYTNFPSLSVKKHVTFQNVKTNDLNDRRRRRRRYLHYLQSVHYFVCINL